MTTNNTIDNSLSSPFLVGGTSVTSSGTQLNLLNTTSLPVFNKINIQVFTASGTYTPTTGMQYCITECIGGGGAGGSAAQSTLLGIGGGGGAGSYSRKLSTAATIGSSQTVTIGAGGTQGASGNHAGGNGGDTSLGSICIGKGGSGGGGSAANSYGAPGSGGVVGTGGVTGVGQTGSYGSQSASTGIQYWLAYGGSSIYGTGGNVQFTSNGDNAAGYGAGGGPGGSFNSSAANQGGNGAGGIMIIIEYISA